MIKEYTNQLITIIKSLIKQVNKSEKNQLNHQVLGTCLDEQLKPNHEEILFGCGCFWGAEKGFWRLPGVVTTAVGYAGGSSPNPSYSEVCSGLSGHAEVVKVVWDKNLVNLSDLLKLFWECHDPTQGNRQGNDVGSQYRSAIYFNRTEHLDQINASKESYQNQLTINGYGFITTEINMNITFYQAEEYHQQYLAKPGSRPYCSAMPTKVKLNQFSGSKFALSEKVWEKYNWEISHCILRSDNKQITL